MEEKEKLASGVLELWPGASPCVQCGHCCRTTCCGYGTWDPVANRCTDLVDKPDGTYDCGKFLEIINGTDESWRIAPAFGAGCCSSMNSARQAIMKNCKKVPDSDRWLAMYWYEVHDLSRQESDLRVQESS